jgi:hypothetical protein
MILINKTRLASNGTRPSQTQVHPNGKKDKLSDGAHRTPREVES